ncbi:GNAT family N-acetyltransferase [bacterium]|nr:GNAT family N-acetyltransferase [bacterium]
MTRVGLARGVRDLQGVLKLQRASRTPTKDGFVTVQHDLDILIAMHQLCPSVLAWDERDQVVAYALSMPIETRGLVPILEPMFEMLESLPLKPRWYVMGQVAVAPHHRGSGVFDALYAEHKLQYQGRFDQLVTEVSTRNPRSLRAHHRVGFQTIKTFRDQTDDWAVICWDWSSC